VPIKLARRVDVGSACVDIHPSPKTDVPVAIFIETKWRASIHVKFSKYERHVPLYSGAGDRHKRAAFAAAVDG